MRGLGSTLYVNDLDAIPFVHSARTPVECRHGPSSFRNERIVRGAPEDPVLRQRRNEPSVLRRREHEERPREAIRTLRQHGGSGRAGTTLKKERVFVYAWAHELPGGHRPH